MRSDLGSQNLRQNIRASRARGERKHPPLGPTSLKLPSRTSSAAVCQAVAVETTSRNGLDDTGVDEVTNFLPGPLNQDTSCQLPLPVAFEAAELQHGISFHGRRRLSNGPSSPRSKRIPCRNASSFTRERPIRQWMATGALRDRQRIIRAPKRTFLAV